MAAIVNVTASFTPSMEEPGNAKFMNTTPVTGFCLSNPDRCTSDEFSIRTSLTSANVSPINTNDSVSLSIPGGKRLITVTNSEGEVHQLYFRISALGATYQSFYLPGSSDVEDRNLWDGGNFASGPGKCHGNWSRYSSSAGTYTFFWRVSVEEDVICTKISTADRGDNLHRLYNTDIMYELDAPNPLQMGSGIYTGTYTYRVGTGMDVDVGGANFLNSETDMTFNFTLSVNHELKVIMNAADLKVTLQPCDLSRVCSEEQGTANWERWMITRVTPFLTGRSGFSISSSGSFTAYLRCEYESEGSCGLKSDNSTQLVPVQTMITFPDNIVDAKTGSGVIKKPLQIGRDVLQNIFHTKFFGQNNSGYIDFQVKQRDVDTMLNTRPDTYRGAVTVIFDSNIY